MVDSGSAGLFSSIPGRVKLLIYALAVNNLLGGYLLVYLTGHLPDLGFSAVSVGLLVAVEGGVAVLLGVPFGLLSDRKGRKWILILGSAGVGPAAILFAVTNGVSYFLVSAIIFGVAESATLTTWNATLADQTEGQVRTEAFSLSFAMGTVATAAGFALPLAFPTLEVATGLNSVSLHFETLAILGIANLATPVALWSLLRSYKETLRSGGPSKRNWGVIAKFTAVNGLIGFGAGLIIPLVPTWLRLKFDVPDTLSGPLLAVGNVTIGFGAIASPRLAKRFGIVKAIVLATGSSTVFMFSLALIPDVGTAAGVFVVRTMLMNMSGPLLDTFIMGQVAPEERGFTSAVNSIIWRLPNTVSTYIGGYLLGTGHYDLPWYFATALYVAGIASFATIFRKSRLAS